MRYEITFDKNESFVTVHTSGKFNVADLQLFLGELISHPKWKAGMNVLVDQRATSLASVTLLELQKVSIFVKQLKDSLGSGGRCAIVLADDAEFTKVAMWKVMTEPEVGFNIEFFDTIEYAKKWLLGIS